MDEPQVRVSEMWKSLFRKQQADQSSIHRNLDSIATNADLLLVANQSHSDISINVGQQAQQILMERYHGAVYRYILAAVGNPHDAADLTQDFALRFIEGRFRHYRKDQGRFRDYLKTALFHLVTDYRRRNGKQKVGLSPELEPEAPVESTPEEDKLFLQSWRKELLARSWDALQALERDQGQPFYTILRYRSENPQQSSQIMAEHLSRQLGKPMTAAGVRKMLERARDHFRQYLLDDLKHSLGDRVDTLEEELIALDLMKYCKDDL